MQWRIWRISAHNASVPLWLCSLCEDSIRRHQHSSETDWPQPLTSHQILTARLSPATLHADRSSHLTFCLFSSHNACTAYSNFLLIPLSCVLSLPFFHCSPIPSTTFLFLHSHCTRSPATVQTTKQEFYRDKRAAMEQAELALDKPFFQMEGQRNPGQSEQCFRVLSSQSQWLIPVLAAKPQVYSTCKLSIWRPRSVTWILRLQFYMSTVTSYWQTQNQLSHHCLAGSFTHFLDPI